MTRYFFLVVVMSTRMKPAPLHAALDLFQLREVQLVKANGEGRLV